MLCCYLDYTSSRHLSSHHKIHTTLIPWRLRRRSLPRKIPCCQKKQQRYSVAVTRRASRCRATAEVDVVTEVKAKTCQLYYWSPWSTPVLHFSACGGQWTDLHFADIASGASTDCWKKVSIRLESSESIPALEFVITDKNGSWDKPNEGGNYLIQSAGDYRLKNGDLKDLKAKSIMVVSDLDGTMVGDDIATKAFSEFWSLHNALTKSLLVYNTGRSLDSFLKLLEEKKDCLKIPDVLISAVGTKIYARKAGQWYEDPGWIAQLHEDWNLSKSIEAVQSAVSLVGSNSMHFRPDEEQNEHKITCGVQKSCLRQVLDHIQAQLDALDLKANLIFSGTGEWRFLDIVSKRAGKLEALNHVREHHGFSAENTVACGDSGNDILMLSGENLAIVVSNAQPDLKEWLKQEQSKNLHSDRLFLANKHEAYGILEGLEKLGFC